MRDNHKKCREELKLARELYKKNKIPLSYSSKKIGNYVYQIKIEGYKPVTIYACCACIARKIVILKLYKEEKELFYVIIGSDEFLTNKAGIKYIDDCAKNNRDIYWAKILKVYDEEKIARLKCEKLDSGFNDVYGKHVAKKRQFELAKKWHKNNR